MKRDDIIREMQSMREGLGYQEGKKILLLSRLPAEDEGPYRVVRVGGVKRPMARAEAVRIVEAAVRRIEAVDQGG